MAPPAPRFREDQRIATGATAVVWRGWDLEIERPVAIKRPHAHLVDDPETRSRFAREARNAAGLRHPGIVTVYDVGVDEDGPWIAMELIEGESLAALVRRRGPLPAKEAAAVGAQIAAALAHAHAVPVVHRDVKPGNALIDPSGRVRLVDFGLARRDEDAALTATGMIAGTPTYLAPEVNRGEAPSPEADVYALGVLLYELLAGAPPFTGNNPVAVAVAHQREPVPPLPAELGVPAGLERLVRRCLAKDPAARPDARALAVGLGELAGCAGAGMVADDPAPTRAFVLPDAATAALARAPGSARRRTAGFAAAGGVAVAVAAAAAVVIGRAEGGGDVPLAVNAGTAAASTTPARTTTAPPASGSTTPSTAAPSVTDDPALARLMEVIQAAAAAGSLEPRRAERLAGWAQEAADAFAAGDPESTADRLGQLDREASQGRLGRALVGAGISAAVLDVAASWGVRVDIGGQREKGKGRGSGLAEAGSGSDGGG